MELISSTGTSLTLTIEAYEFPDIPAEDLDEDGFDDWLFIVGRVVAEDREWSFRDPCLMVREAGWVSEWFRAVAEGTMPPIPIAEPDYENPDMLTFMEPNLGFSCERRMGDEVLIRAYLSIEALPTDLDEQMDHYEYAVDLLMTTTQLAAATDAWDEERRAFPARG